MKQSKLLLGSHMSIAGGIEKSIERGMSIGCTAIQVFLKSNRQWKAKPINNEHVELFKSAWRSSTISFVMAHTTYLINLASSQEETVAKSIEGLVYELTTCDTLTIPYLVLHPGSYSQGTKEQRIAQIAASLDIVFSQTPGKTIILLETMAGQGSSIGSTFQDLATIIKLTQHNARLGVCLDTCHVFAAGYDFSSPSTYKAMWKEFDDIIGLSRLKAIHLNDSKKGLGSRLDRHEHIGKGSVSLAAFELLINDPALFDIPKILETEKSEDLHEDVMNMNTLKSLLHQETRRQLHINSAAK